MRSRHFKVCCALLTTLCLTTCAGQDETLAVKFHTAPYPEKLSEWGLLNFDGEVVFAEGVIPYDLNMPLFSDYAHKLRTVYFPDNKAATYNSSDAFEFPVGTVVTKSFFYNIADGEILLDTVWDGAPENIQPHTVRVLETRLLVRQSHGWDALPYVWRGNDAYLSISGDLLTLATNSGELNYLVPSKNQCASCHATNHSTGAIQPIGLKARHLNRTAPHREGNQLTNLAALGHLQQLPRDPADVPQGASWIRIDDDLAHQARSYLDINCGHCHNPNGAADTSGLLLDYDSHSLAEMGMCKPPIAAGRGSGGYLYSIIPGQADKSIMTFRLNTTDPGAMMPELGRTVVHREGVQLISDWINSLDGQCL